MPATAASHLIFFVAAVMISGILAGVFYASINSYSDAIEKRGRRLSLELSTDIEIINDPVAMPYNASNNTLTVYVKNTGSTVIPLSSIAIMVNGTYYLNLTIYVIGGGEWVPEATVTVIMGDVTLTSGEEYRLKVIVIYGVNDVIVFRV